MPNHDPRVQPARKVNDIQGEMRADAYLTNFSLSYRQEASNHVGPRAATNVPVNNSSDLYSIYPKGYFYRDEAERRPLGGRPVQVGYKVENGQYLAEEWALEHTIDDRQRANANGLHNLDENGVRLLEGKMLIREDRIWATQFMKTGVWTYEVDLATSADDAPFSDAASNPISTIDAYKTAMMQQTGFEPNTIVLGANVKNALRVNDDITDRIKYTQKGVASMDVLAGLFEVDNVMVARGVYNAAAEGATDDIEWIVDPNAFWMGYIAPTPSLDAPTAIARFGWTGLHPGANRAGGVILRGRDGRARSDWIQSSNAFDYKLVSADLGCYFSNANVPVS